MVTLASRGISRGIQCLWEDREQAEKVKACFMMSHVSKSQC